MGYFTHLLNKTIFLKRLINIDSNGKKEFSPAEKIKCRIEFSSQYSSGGNAMQDISDGVLYTETFMNCGDEVETEGKSYTVLSCAPQFVLDGENTINQVNFK